MGADSGASRVKDIRLGLLFGLDILSAKKCFFPPLETAVDVAVRVMAQVVEQLSIRRLQKTQLEIQRTSDYGIFQQSDASSLLRLSIYLV